MMPNLLWSCDQNSILCLAVSMGMVALLSQIRTTLAVVKLDCEVMDRHSDGSLNFGECNVKCKTVLGRNNGLEMFFGWFKRCSSDVIAAYSFAVDWGWPHNMAFLFTV